MSAVVTNSPHSVRPLGGHSARTITYYGHGIRGNTPNPPALLYRPSHRQGKSQFRSQQSNDSRPAKSVLAPSLVPACAESSASAYFSGHKTKAQVYSHPLQRAPAAGQNADFAPIQQGPKESLGNSVTVARLTLDQLVQVRILVPQLLPRTNRHRRQLFDKGTGLCARPKNARGRGLIRAVGNWEGWGLWGRYSL